MADDSDSITSRSQKLAQAKEKYSRLRAIFGLERTNSPTVPPPYSSSDALPIKKHSKLLDDVNSASLNDDESVSLDDDEHRSPERGCSIYNKSNAGTQTGCFAQFA